MIARRAFLKGSIVTVAAAALGLRLPEVAQAAPADLGPQMGGYLHQGLYAWHQEPIQWTWVMRPELYQELCKMQFTLGEN